MEKIMQPLQVFFPRQFSKHRAKVETADMRKKTLGNVGMTAKISPTPASGRERVRKGVFVVRDPQAEKMFAASVIDSVMVRAWRVLFAFRPFPVAPVALRLLHQDQQPSPEKNMPDDMQDRETQGRKSGFFSWVDMDKDNNYDSAAGCMLSMLVEIAITLFFLFFLRACR
ncbi:MAG: hypothetical protein LBV15_05770 [Planctomycetota bacterium]|jgi:hypothetical protein|nr:hypothetical protein [Planctomycetota bacterium]